MDQPRIVTALHVAGIILLVCAVLAFLAAFMAFTSAADTSPALAMSGEILGSALIMFALGAIVEKLVQIEYYLRGSPGK